jgi:hypothetical protein
LWLNIRRAPDMQDLHHSDILAYALTRMATEFARDKQGTLEDLQRCIDESHHRRGLGGTRHEELDEAGPGYAIRAGKTGHRTEDDKVTAAKTK